MEDLTKQQLVLLTLLVSFVTSIATGIVTVSLVSQAPTAASQTINRVIQQTVQQILPGTSTTTTVTNTVVEDNDTAATAAITSVQSSIVRLSNSADGFAGIALVATKGGELLTDAPLTDKTYEATFSDGGTVNYAVATSSGAFSSLVLIATSSRAFLPVSLAPTNDLVLGKSVIGLTGQNATTVRIGAIGSIDTASSTITDLEPTFTLPGAIDGSPLILLSGQVAGMLSVEADGTSVYLPSSSLTAFMASDDQ